MNFITSPRSNAKSEKATWPFGAPIKYDGKKRKTYRALKSSEAEFMQ